MTEYDVQDVDALMFYTDGMIEAAPPDGEILGIEPVVAHLKELGDTSGENLIAETQAIVKTHVGGSDVGDDMTLLTLNFSK